MAKRCCYSPMTKATCSADEQQFPGPSAAVENKRVYALGNDTFRLDYYSASNLLTRLEKLFISP